MRVSRKPHSSTNGFSSRSKSIVCQDLGDPDRLELGDVVADDLFGLLEGHHQCIRLLAWQDIEAVKGEIVSFDAGIGIREGAGPIGAASAFERASIVSERRNRRRSKDRRRPWRRQRRVEAGNNRLHRVLRRVEQEVAFFHVVGHLAVAVDQLGEVGSERESHDIYRG